MLVRRTARPTMLMPWNVKEKMRELKAFADSDIKTSASLTSRIVALCRRDVNLGEVSNAFSTYFESRNSMPEADVINIVIPTVVRLIKDAAKIMSKVSVIPLPIDSTESHSYTRLQVAVIVVHMWLGAFNGYDYAKDLIDDMDMYAIPSLIEMFKSSNSFALGCMLGYIRYVGDHIDDKAWCKQRVIYRRYAHGAYAPLRSYDSAMKVPYVAADDVDNTASALRIISANEQVGGKGFSGSCTQEEVVMLARPECMVLMLIAPHPTRDGRCINCVIGAEKISQYGGYGSSLHYDGPFTEDALVVQTADNNTFSQIAHAFVMVEPVSTIQRQYQAAFEADVQRLIVGFSSVPITREGAIVAIGDLTYEFITPPRELRVLQASIASAITGRTYACCTKDKELQNDIEQYAEWVDGKTVNEVIGTYVSEISAAWKRYGNEMDTRVLMLLVTS